MALPGKEVTREVGTLLQDRMRARGVSQTTLANQVGLSQPQLSRYLSGKRDWKLSLLVAVCDFLGTRASDVISVAEDTVGQS